MAEIVTLIDKLSSGQDLTEGETSRVIQIIMNGGATPVQAAAFLSMLALKGETVGEITGAVKTMRHKMSPLDVPANLQDKIVDTCGTGGDKKGTYNISTAVAFVVAGAGAPVVKHGNKGVSSKSGSSDVLTELGINNQISAEQSLRCLAEANICFLFAPLYHKSMKNIAPVRQELGIKTIFNILGPLSNPAKPKRQLMGVYSKELVRPICEVLKNLELSNAMVVHGGEGLDEVSICDTTYIAELQNGVVKQYQVTPEEFGIKRYNTRALKGGDANHNAKAMTDILNGNKTMFEAYYNSVIFNSAFALKVAGLSDDIKSGIKLAEETIQNGKAKEALKKLVEFSNNTQIDN